MLKVVQTFYVFLVHIHLFCSYVENPDSTETVFAEGKTSTENGEDRSQPGVYLWII